MAAATAARAAAAATDRGTSPGWQESGGCRQGVLSRETAEFGEGPVEVVGDTLAEQSPERLLSCGGETADSVGMGLDARPHNFEEFRFRCRPAVCAEEPVESAWPGREVGESLGGDNVPGVQGHPAEGSEGQVPFWCGGPGEVPVEEPGQCALVPGGVVGGGGVVADGQAWGPGAA